ncbi:MAG: ABC transporter permease [Mangrovibacterium sp.]
MKQIIRLLNKDRRTTLLLVFSLFVGFATYILISARVGYHLSFDKQVPDYQNFFRIVTSAYTDNVLTFSQPRSQRALGETLRKNYPDVLETGYLCGLVDNHFKVGDETFTVDKAFHCSEGFVKLFSIQILQGDSKDLLTNPYMVIVSESFAERYFPGDSPVGKTILQYPGGRFEIEAVYKDLPVNSHFHADLLLSFHDDMHLPPPLKEAWGEFAFYTYLRLSPLTDLNKIEKALSQLTFENNHGGIKGSRSRYKFDLQPLASIHTKSHLQNEIEPNVRGDYLSILKLISIYILLISGFNYFYFSHTRILKNSMQYGIRKIFGAKPDALFRFFLMESALIHLAAIMLFLITASTMKSTRLLILPETGFSNLPTGFWIGCIFVFITSMILNPVIILLSIYRKKSLSLLARQKKNYLSGYSSRHLLTIVQFIIIVFLLTSVIGIQKQMGYLRSRDNGIDINNKLVIKSPANLWRDSRRFVSLDAFEQELIKLPPVKSLSVSNNVPGDVPSFNFSVSDGQNEKSVKTAVFIANRSFVNAYDLKIIAGNSFFAEGWNSSPKIAKGCILNETCLHQLGYLKPEDAVGRNLTLTDESGLDNVETRVAGVCKDFNFTSVKDAPGPLILLDWTQSIMVGRYTLTVNQNVDKVALLAEVKKRFTKTFPDFSFNYFWLDDHYNQQFSEEDSIERALTTFAVLAIILGILTMFSMVRHISTARTKEVGIRKINGARRSEIVVMLNKNFIKSVAISFVIATPLAYYAMHRWLENFAYKTPLSWWIFALAGLLALGIALLTVSWQSWKAATRNPVEALRYE